GAANITIDDSGGTDGRDALIVYGTNSADAVTLDKQLVNGVIYGRVLLAAAGTTSSDTLYYKDVERFVVSTLGGKDTMQLNDNLTTTEIYAGAGDDQITIGFVATFINNEGIEVVDLPHTTNGVSAVT